MDCVNGNTSSLASGAKHHYVYERALELSDEPPLVLVLARDPDYQAGSEKCFIEHIESIAISMLDACHTNEGHSKRLARGSQHHSLFSARDHEGYEGLNRMLPVKQSVTSHLPGDHVECRNCNLDVPKHAYRAHLDSEGDTRTIYIYEICDSDLKSAITLSAHMLTHDPSCPFECEHCDKAFKIAWRLANHVKTHDPHYKVPTCEICAKTFEVTRSLTEHMLLHDEDTANAFTCNECGRGFPKQHRLNAHMLIHVTDRPYECQYEGCEKAYKWVQSRDLHQRTHTERSRDFACTVLGCDKTYLDPTGLKAHMVTHSDNTHPFPCEVEGCGKRYITAKDLKQHMISHSDDQSPFKCPSEGCTKKFKSATACKNHQLSHTADPFPWKCDVEGCELKYQTKSSLATHRKKHQTCKHCNEVIPSVKPLDVKKHEKMCSTEPGIRARWEALDKRKAADEDGLGIEDKEPKLRKHNGQEDEE